MQVLEEKKEVVKGNNNKPRSESVPEFPRDTRSDSHDSSIDSDGTNPKPTNPSNNESDSDSDCYVGPLELQQAVSMSYTEGIEHHKHSNKNTTSEYEYDYPYMQQFKPPSQHACQNTRNSVALSHNKVYISKSPLFDSNSNPENIADGEQYEVLSSLKPTSHILPHVETLEPLNEDNEDGYVKMQSEKSRYVNAMVKSHSYDDGRVLSSKNTEWDHEYKKLNRLTLATDGRLSSPIHNTS